MTKPILIFLILVSSIVTLYEHIIQLNLFNSMILILLLVIKITQNISKKVYIHGF